MPNDGSGSATGVISAPAIDYWAWPTLVDVRRLMAACNVTTRFEAGSSEEDDYIAAVIAAVTEEFEQETYRQFVASADMRYFDGNGTSVLDVDDMVELDSITIVAGISDPGYTMVDVALSDQYRHGRSQLIAGRGSFPRLWGMTSVFPVGRLNIGVAGTFGYAASIPRDAWNGVAGEIAHRIAQNTIFRPLGRIEMQKNGVQSEKYKLDDPVVAGWRFQFRHALARYRRRSAPRLRELRGRMI